MSAHRVGEQCETVKTIEIGEVLDGRYRVLETLGAGGMGKVFKAKQVKLDRIVALKVPSASVMGDESFLRRFEREAKAVARFHHDNIVMIHDVFVGESERGKLAYISMEYVDGQELDKFVLSHHWDLTIADLLDVVRQCCEGLECAHRKGVIHRDIKPANIYVTRGDRTVKIMDFGIARISDETQLTMTGHVMGTPYYMSPEQIKGLQLGPPSDIYAMSVMIYLLLTMKHVFEGETTTLIYKHINEPPPPPGQINPRVPGAVDQVLLRGLAKEPSERFTKATELAAALDLALASMAATPYHELLRLSREEMMALGIPLTPPPIAGVELGATISAVPGTPPAARPPAASPPPQAPPAAPPVSPRAAPPPPAPAAAPTTGESLAPTGTRAFRAASGMARATTSVSKVAAKKVALPTAKYGGLAIWKTIQVPARFIWTLPPRARLLTIMALVLGGGGAGAYLLVGSEGRSRVVSQSRERAGSTFQSVRDRLAGKGAENRMPALAWVGASRMERVSRSQFQNMLRTSTLFQGRDPDGRVVAYEITFDNSMPLRIENRSSGAVQWPPPRAIAAGQHQLQIVAIDEEDGRSQPIAWDFFLTEPWQATD
jgi:serine/threonine-protein kinase